MCCVVILKHDIYIPTNLPCIVSDVFVEWKHPIKVLSNPISLVSTVKPVYNGHSQKDENGFQDRLSFNAGQKYCRILQMGFTITLDIR